MLRGARCLLQVDALAASAAVAAQGAGLLQRLQSSWFCSTSCASSSLASNAAQRHSPLSALSQQHIEPLLPACNAQQALPRLGSRAYARAAAGGRFGRSRREEAQFNSQQQQQQWTDLSQLQLGRHPRHCIPTEAIREAVDMSEYDPFQDRDPRSINPVQVDGSRGDGLEEVMLLRQQLEGSALPNEFKRSHFISPYWEEVLLDVNRTIKVTKGGKVETLHALVVVGNHDGLLGVGQHSGKNIQKVMLDAQLKAYQQLVAIPRYRGHTVYHTMDVTRRKVRMQVWPRQAGFGVTASPLITALCDLAGLHNVTVKLSGNRKNVRNVVQVFVEAMAGQSLPHDGVEGSGVYMREVYARKLPCGLRRGADVP